MEEDRRTRRGFAAPTGEGGAPGGEPDPNAPEHASFVPSHPELAAAIVTPITRQPAETFSGHFLGISLRRAFRLHILNEEVLPQERAHLASKAGHVTDPDQQAFLAWRRSVLLLIAVMFIPLTVFRFLETFDGPQIPKLGHVFVMIPAFAEGLFCIVMFSQLKNWAHWKKQRRIMFIGWALYFIAPFIVYLYPFRSAFDDSYYLAKTAAELGGVKLGINRSNFHMVVGLAFGVQALLGLGPKVISLMPGLIRASIVTKLLFPGTTAPGWLMMLAAPFYALFAYVIVLLPYQITGSWEFVVGNTGILLAQVFIGVSGRRLTVPLSTQESSDRIHKSWLAYIAILVVSAGFMVYGLSDFIHELNLGKVRVVTGLLALVSNVLLDTLVGTDAIVASMAFFRRRGLPDPQHERLLRDAEAKLDKFVA
ncbi:MAG: hypothetical protein JWO36_6108 [Myxococcales bacterium]|nr:hypothetical protein [Myxococcales bacterium]